MQRAYSRWLYVFLCVLLCAGACLSFFLLSGHSTDRFEKDDPESFVMVNAAAFQSALPAGVRHIVFSDTMPSFRDELVDLSNNGRGGVVGWEDDGVFTVSTRTSGQPVILNPDSAGLFANLSHLARVELSMADTSRVTDFMRFFYNCTALGEVDISSFDFQSAVRTRSMFMNCVSLSSVTLGEGDMSTIRDTAFMFSGTGKLEVIDLSHTDLSGVICSTAMFQQTGAKTILLPDSLSVLGSFFFNHATHYAGESFALPASVKELSGAHLFYNMGTDAFSAFTLPEGNAFASVKDGILYSADGTRLLALPKGKRFANGVFEIPEGVTFLGELSFSRNPYVKTVILPNSYRVRLYEKQNHPDFSDISGSGNKNVGNSLNLAAYAFSGVRAYAVKEDNPYYTAHNDVLYEKREDGTPCALVAVPLKYEGELSLPEGVEEWHTDALFEISEADFSALSAIRIPSTLTHIAESQINKINALGVRVTVDEDNPVYAVNAEGKLCFKK